MRVSLLEPIFFHLNNLYCQIAGLLSPLIILSPLVLRIRITSKCNLSCPFCYLKTGLNRDEEGNLSLEEWEKIFSKLPKRTIVDLTGAEPLMYKDIRGFLNILSNCKLKYSMTTNGTVYNGLTAKEIVEKNLYILMVSLDGTEKIHDELRGKSGAFSRTLGFLKEVEKEKARQGKSRPFINIKTTVLDENIDDLNLLLKSLGREIPCDTLTLSLLFQNRARGGMELYDDIDASELQTGNTASYVEKRKVSSFFKELKTKKNSYKVSVRPRMNYSDIEKYIESPASMHVESCPQFKNTITLNYDGNISPCDISLKLGNIRDHEYDLRSIYRTQKFERFKSLFKKRDPICEGCCSGLHTSKD